jgi:H+/gluconate symporter-like permease
MLSLIGVVVAIALFMYLVFKGTNMFITVMICGAVVALTSQLDIYTALTDTFVSGFAKYIAGMLPTFIMGAVYGEVLGITGAAESIAHMMLKYFGTKHVEVIMTLITALLVWGGVSGYVVVFAVFPLFLVMFKEADLPRRFIPGAIFTGINMGCAVPGTPQADMLMCVNALPGVTLMSGAVVGWIVTVFYFICGPLIVSRVCHNAKAKGEHFVAHPTDVIEGSWDPKNASNPWLALACMAGTIILVNIKKDGVVIFPAVLGLFLGTVLTLIVMFKWVKKEKIMTAFVDGIKGGMGIAISVATVNGFGAIVKSAPCFTLISNFIAYGFGNVLVGAAAGTGILAGVCASATGGLGIMLSFMPQVWAAQTQVTMGAIARTIKIACGTFDSLPHNGMVNAVMGGVCGETHKTAYKLFFYTSVIMTLIGTIIAVVLFTVFPALQAM